MNRRIFITQDGSHSVMVDELRESFHSEKGSWQESVHTFINQGFKYLFQNFKPTEIKLFEVGFGTGLNAALMQKQAEIDKIKVFYKGIEAYPLENKIWENLNYPTIIEGISKLVFENLHQCEWNQTTQISPYFNFEKIHNSLLEFKHQCSYNLVFFDAFAPSVQPELWSESIFKNLYNSMQSPSVLVTYSAAGMPRRAMAKAGFWIDEIRGAAGKREMTRCLKW